MLKLWIAAVVAFAAGLLVGVFSRPSICWHPGMAMNNPIAIPAGCEQE